MFVFVENTGIEMKHDPEWQKKIEDSTEPLIGKLRSGNKIWWLCLVPTSTTRFASDVGYRMDKNE